jgi:hypothetical protein
VEGERKKIPEIGNYFSSLCFLLLSSGSCSYNPPPDIFRLSNRLMPADLTAVMNKRQENRNRALKRARQHQKEQPWKNPTRALHVEHAVRITGRRFTGLRPMMRHRVEFRYISRENSMSTGA